MSFRKCLRWIFDVILWFTLILVTSHRKVLCLQCPRSTDAWERASQALQCKEPNYYHCLRDENSRLVEQCLARLWIQPGMCPEYNSRVTRIDVGECSSLSCPQSVYWSNSVYLFPICYGPELDMTLQVSRPTLELTTRSPDLVTSDRQKNTTFKEQDTDNDSPGPDRASGGREGTHSDMGVIVSVSVGVIAVLIVALVIFWWWCRRRKGNNSSNKADLEQTENPLGEAKDNLLNQQSEEQKNEAEDFKKMSSIKFSEEASIIKGRHCQENPQDEETCNLLNQQSQQQQKVVDSMKVSSEGISEEKSNAIERCQVYVPEGTGKTGGQFIGSTRILVLSLLPTSSGEITEINKEAQKMFGGQYFYCRTLNYFLKHKQEQQASVLLKDFDFKTSDVDAILRKLHDVVSVSNLAFVLTVPLKDFTSNREKIMSIITKDKDIFKHKHV